MADQVASVFHALIDNVESIVRGKADDGRDLVISRDYISHGMRARAEHRPLWNSEIAASSCAVR